MPKVKKDRKHPLVTKEEEISNLFKNRKYLEIIKIVKNSKKILDLDFLDYSFFNNKVACLIYAGLSYAELGFYQDAYDTFSEVGKKFSNLKYSRLYWRGIAKYPTNKENFKMAKDALTMLQEQIDVFNMTNYVGYLSNMAYICYKLKNYKLAIIFYKKALVRKSKDIQLNLGIAQAQYYFYRKKYKFEILNNLFCSHIPNEIRTNYTKTIDMLFRMDTSFDSLLAIGKMYYFLEDYPKSLLFVQKAIELVKEQPEAKVHAYDWLSRIAFKTKHYEVAAEYYNQIIREIIECSEYTQGAIHPKPNLYNMLEYLTQNKEKLRKHDVHYINKSIWGGIIAAIILECFEIYSGGNHNIVILGAMILIVLLVSVFYINIYK